MFLIGCTQEVLMMKVTAYKDPLTLSVDIAQEREKALVLWEMEKRKKRLEELCKAIPSMLKKEIMEQLDELISLGLVSRIVHVHKKPTMIEYALTNRGAMLLKCLRKNDGCRYRYHDGLSYGGDSDTGGLYRTGGGSIRIRC